MSVAEPSPPRADLGSEQGREPGPEPGPEPGLEQLVRRAQDGDRAALEEVLLRIRPLVLRRCSRFLPHRADAEDAAQEALLTIARKLDGYAGRGSFGGWVTVISSNAARATYRALRDRADLLGVPHAAPETSDPRTTSVIAGTRLDLLDAITALDRHLPAAAESFVLRDLGELSYGEIADLTDTPLGTVKDRIHRARIFVQARLRVDRTL